MAPACITCSQPERLDARPGWSWSLAAAWRVLFRRRSGAPTVAAPAFERRLHRDIGLDPPETWSDGRCGRDFSRYLQYY